MGAEQTEQRRRFVPPPVPPPHVAEAIEQFNASVEGLVEVAMVIGGTRDRQAAIRYIHDRLREDWPQ